ncbi:DHS-like NAD/FAD-binding domain-containing protein [Tothia fuscella]|uniref:DHS-like NAD/FAD-binding domain-containing protein n=1 Tax=Tothia fuscella TaxID=1048955 RepID=A0A9P4NS37_9PEZI|nr:DHS-like NAD/FAD-binding domain-containing protein [Tothia fuscella]
MPLMRIPYTSPLPLPKVIPPYATTPSTAITALCNFLSPSHSSSGKTVLLTGAGISVASGLADYRGTNGTYTLNKTYRPIYYHEFVKDHEARKRYWARSFLGWTNLERARRNGGHVAVGELGRLGVVGGVITQNVDSFHPETHPSLPTLELHGYLRSLVCLSCRNEYPRNTFQSSLSMLNPSWATFLEEMLATGALTTEDPMERRSKGLRTNPDGDVDVPNANYTTFRYPACPVCMAKPPVLGNGEVGRIEVDSDGGWLPGSTAGVLKPAVIMFGESIPNIVKEKAENMIDEASRILVIGSSLATYSAWRLVKRAKERGMGIGILNIGGARGEDTFYSDMREDNDGTDAVRISERSDLILPEVVKVLEEVEGFKGHKTAPISHNSSS